jgi:hypothetical protein
MTPTSARLAITSPAGSAKRPSPDAAAFVALATTPQLSRRASANGGVLIDLSGEGPSTPPPQIKRAALGDGVGPRPLALQPARGLLSVSTPTQQLRTLPSASPAFGSSIVGSPPVFQPTVRTTMPRP